MTNGEKLIEIFPNNSHISLKRTTQFVINPMTINQQMIVVDNDFWNAEYKEPTTKKDCNTCTHNTETDGSNCYECVKDMCNNYEPITKNNLGVEEVTAFAEWTTAYSQGYADGVKSVNICPYCGEYIGEEE